MTDALRNRVGSVVRRCASRTSIATRSGRCWRAGTLLVKIKQNLENQIRGLLKNLALVIGRAKFNVFTVRAEELIEDRPELIAMVGPPYPASCGIVQDCMIFNSVVVRFLLRIVP